MTPDELTRKIETRKCSCGSVVMRIIEVERTSSAWLSVHSFFVS